MVGRVQDGGSTPIFAAPGMVEASLVASPAAMGTLPLQLVLSCYFPEPGTEVFSQLYPRGYQKANQPDQAQAASHHPLLRSSIIRKKEPQTKPKTHSTPLTSTKLQSGG